MAADLPFTEDDLRRVAGRASYSRGLEYLDEVEQLEIAGNWVAATVFGNDAYSVRLSFGSGLHGSCSCPFGAEGNFCKHCVATGLVALTSGDLVSERTSTALETSDDEEHPLIAWLESLTRDELYAELLDLIIEVPGAASHLELRKAARQADADGVRAAVRRLIWVTNDVGYHGAGAYAGNVLRAVEVIGDLIDAGAAADAIEVARDAIEWMRQCFGMIDDSPGDIGSAAYELLDVHLLACQAAPPDPVELAGYLAGLYLTSEFPFMPALAEYAELLGEAGAAVLRERVTAAYEAKPDDIHTRYVMESVIAAEGDVDALVAFYATHLSENGWQHLRIAQTLDAADRAEEALEWAERGLAAGSRPHHQLVAYLVDRYTAAGRTGDVLGLRRTVFAGDRSLENFRALRTTAIEAGAWDAERETALSQLRKDAAAAQRTLWLTWGGPVLVDALIDDGGLTAAWTAAQDIASEPQWIRLASASITTRPADALAVYVTVIERLTHNTGDAIYKQIAAHLLSARACHEALGTMDKFRQYMVLLRMGQKRKRNLMAILDQNGL